MGTGRGKCRADGCTVLVEAKVKVEPQEGNEKVPHVGLCAPHAITWLGYLQGDTDRQPFPLKPHKDPLGWR